MILSSSFNLIHMVKPKLLSANKTISRLMFTGLLIILASWNDNFITCCFLFVLPNILYLFTWPGSVGFLEESSPPLQKCTKVPLPVPEYQRDWWSSILLHHLLYTSDTIIPGLSTAHTSWPSANLRTQACRQASGPRPSQSYSVQPRLPLAATIGPACRSKLFFYWVWSAAL